MQAAEEDFGRTMDSRLRRRHQRPAKFSAEILYVC